MAIDVSAARNFIYANARLLEQLVYAFLFEQGDSSAVARAVAAYQNDDGGFGHGLEPDTRSPFSQPLNVEIALERIFTVGAKAPDLVSRACDFLVTVADPTGAVPVLLPSIADHPRATHWMETVDFTPGLNPTAGIAAYAHAIGVTHPWVDKASDYCFAVLEDEGPPPDAHTLLCVTRFLEHAPHSERAAPLHSSAAAAVSGSSFFQETPDPDNYGVTPLQFAPTPSSLARTWFTDTVIEAHLDNVERQQESDGGWPIRWQPPGDAGRCEWRAIRALEALRVLTAYGRIEERPCSMPAAAASSSTPGSPRSAGRPSTGS